MITPIAIPSSIPNVPFYSQFTDIQIPTWQKVGCGITSLAMIIDYYQPNTVSVSTLLTLGIADHAYDHTQGWTYSGLVEVATEYGFSGKSYDFGKQSASSSLASISAFLNDGPVIASIHYKFNPKSSIPHLVVINGIKDGVVYYNDPAAKTGEKTIALADFQKGWKKRFIVIRPAS